MTVYVVLQAAPTETVEPNERRAVWRDVGRGEASSAQRAIRAYVDANGSKGGEFIAVPERSFIPRTVKAEQQTRLVFS